MKKEVKRYTIVEYIKNHERIFETQEELLDFLARQSKYNATIMKSKPDGDIKSRLIFGNNTIKDLGDKKILSFSRLLKITEPMSLKETDAFTIQKKNSSLLKKEYINKMQSISHSLLLCYKTNGLLKTTPILYEPDKIYFDTAYLTKSLYYCTTIDEKIIYDISTNPLFQNNPSMIVAMENFRTSWENSVLYGDNRLLYYSIKELIDQFCHKRNPKTNKVEVDYKKYRDIIFFVKQEEERISEKIELQNILYRKKK